MTFLKGKFVLHLFTNNTFSTVITGRIDCGRNY